MKFGCLVITLFLATQSILSLVASDAGNGQSSMAGNQLLAAPPYELIWSDEFDGTSVNMPGSMDGVGFAQWLHQHAPDVPVILTSGVNSSLEAARRACANVHELTPKPYSYDMISGQIRAVLRARD